MNNSTSDTHFDAIVVGSGFGGSVTAYRLAEEELSVCVLERGKPYPPDSFPRSPHRMKNNFWDPSSRCRRELQRWVREMILLVTKSLGRRSSTTFNTSSYALRNIFFFEVL